MLPPPSSVTAVKQGDFFMDPNNPGQNTGAPTPDPWGQPQPGQPQYPQQPPAGPAWGAPPAGYDPSQQPAQPAYSQQPYDPNAYGQQPYGQQPYDPNAYGQQPYGQQPYGQPQWGAVPPKKSKLPRILGIVGGIVVAFIVLAVVAALVVGNPNAGKVVFTADAPTSSGAKTCELSNKVTSINVGDSVYMNIFFKNRLSGETVTLTLLKDGKEVDSIPYGTAAEVNGIDCLEDYTNLADVFKQNGAGSYEFKLTDSKGNVVSDGTLIVK
jgi:hypothetical protein